MEVNKCGKHCTWGYDKLKHKLTIQGESFMFDYSYTEKTPWNEYITEIEEIEIKGILSVGRNAFKGCTKLNKVSLSESVLFIGENAFEGCTGLKMVTELKYIANIGKFAFAECKELKQLKIGALRTKFNYPVFYGIGDNLTILCKPGSYAELYAKKQKIKYEIIE